MRPIARTRQLLTEAKAIAVLTGAGVSAESGVPTFRGKEGLWRNYRAEQLANPLAFEYEPRIVWEWYNWRRELIAPLTPNPAHKALATLEAEKESFILITQNIDGLHAKAGSRNILELHGNIWKVRCTECETVSDNTEVPIGILPHCGECNGLLRPHVVWFGENLETDILDAALAAAEACDLFVVIGTSSIVQPAASLAQRAAGNGAKVLEINLEATPLSPSADLSVFGKAGEILPSAMP